jgi:hypothetical protein
MDAVDVDDAERRVSGLQVNTLLCHSRLYIHNVHAINGLCLSLFALGSYLQGLSQTGS